MLGRRKLCNTGCGPKINNLTAMRSNHKDLPPFFEPIPKGRAAVDVALYKIMRHIARKNRRALWAACTGMVRDAVLFGTGYAKIGGRK